MRQYFTINLRYKDLLLTNTTSTNKRHQSMENKKISKEHQWERKYKEKILLENWNNSRRMLGDINWLVPFHTLRICHQITCFQYIPNFGQYSPTVHNTRKTKHKNKLKNSSQLHHKMGKKLSY